MSTQLRPTGIPIVGDLPWGVHVCLFYETPSDLLDAVVPFFASGLEGGERCAWVPSEPSIEERAVDALRARVRDFDARMARGDLQILGPDEFYLTNGKINVAAIMAKWAAWDAETHEQGKPGLRVSGNLAWLQRADWTTFADYERTLHDFMVARRIITLCTYPLGGAMGSDVLDVAQTHHSVMARRNGEWEILEEGALATARTELQRLNAVLEARVAERTNQLRRNERYLEQGESLSHTGSCGWDPATREYTYWSAESFRIFGWEPRPSPPSRADVLARVHPADRSRFDKEIAAITRERRAGDLEFRVVRSDGSIRHIHKVAQPLMDGSGRVVEFVATEADVTDLKRAEARLARVKRRARERALKTRFAATLEERTRLAREIHDSVLQDATGIALQLRALLPNLGRTPPSTVAKIRGIVALAESTIREARRAVWDMRSPLILQKGLARALEDEARHAAGDVELDFAVTGVPRPLTPTVDDTIFRVGQEAVVNAARHSEATRIMVELEYRPRSTRLMVRDDGRGFDVDPIVRASGGRWGLLGMRERAERIGATLAIKSRKGRGTTIELRIRSRRARRPDEQPGKSRFEEAS